ncbi:type I polyketide synthase [Streptomyces sp. NBRC 109706]|uniref:type I polyketide synthase n=1 Tax=Streptomyces sp. NBRC 109706 TaxID=1550035 RepID=UPI0007849D32|nr:type I polyketide synthase [Streptomyces sp. NBRC 109706]
MVDDGTLREYLKLVTADLHQTKQRLREAEKGNREPIAIVGMSCRFPGGVRTPEDLWRLVLSGTDAIGPFPDDRGWQLPPRSDTAPDADYAREGGFVDEATRFDAAFFDISPREALAMDPQQRLLLQTSWEAVEAAGIAPSSLRGSRTGVFVGANDQHYTSLLGAEQGNEGYLLTGGATAVISGRVAYTLGLEGPAVTVDTACSSSLVALHLACQSLRRGESTLALAGGVTVMATPGVFAEFSRQRGLAADGRCKSFAAAADGTGWSEGVGVLVVERLSDALRLNHPVLAVVRGSAVNQDGASNGLTAPNGPSQQRVILQALAEARLTPDQVDAVEAHGTGTPLGDPIEAQSLIAAYGQDRPADRPLWIGSVKSNIGHVQAAAGVASVIKTVLALRHGVLPPTLHVDEPTPHVDWTAGAVGLLTEARELPPTGDPHRMGVSSFGLSGTNAHLILEQPPAPEAAEAPAGGRTPAGVPLPFPISARTATALPGQAAGLRALVESEPGLDLAALGHALATTRAALPHRAVLTAADRDELLAALTAVEQGAESGLVRYGVARRTRPAAKLAMLFTGQGAQRAGMGRELYAAEPVFARALDEVCAGLDPHLGRPLREVLFADAGTPEAELLDRTEYAQVGLFALEVALYRLFEHRGVRPDYLLGHSVGELAAALVAGVWSLPDACRLVAARGRLMQRMTDDGAMLAVRATEDEVDAALAGLTGRVGIAAVNGPTSVVVSGDRDAVDQLAARWREQDVRTRRLRVSHAFHSAHMDPMLDEFRAIAAALTYARPTIPIVADLTGDAVDPDLLTDPEYWVRQVREAVRFADGVAWLDGQGVARYLELGPDGVLSAMAEESLTHRAEPAVVVPALRGALGEPAAATAALAELHASGLTPDWAAVFAGVPGGSARPVALPTYAFETVRYWPRLAGAAGDVTAAGLGVTRHPLLGAGVSVAEGDELLFFGWLSTGRPQWSADHTVLGRPVLPGTALVELAIRAGDQVGCGHVEELLLQTPLALPERGGVQVQVAVGAADGTGRRSLTVHARPDAPGDEGWPDREWTRHASGFLTPQPPNGPAGDGDWARQWPPADAVEVPVDGLYQLLGAAGLAYGPAFRGIRSVWRRGGEIFAEVGLPESEASQARAYGVHPALLDAALQAQAGAGADGATAGVPFSFAGVTLTASGAAALRVRLTPGDGGGVAIAATDPSGDPVLSIERLDVRPVAAEPEPAGQVEGLCRLAWHPLPTGPVADAVPAGPAVDAAGLGALLADGSPPGTVVLRVHDPAAVEGGDEPARVRALTGRVLGALQRWLADERCAGARLVLLTRNAVLAVPGDRAPDAAAAAVWGLVRAAQSEEPGRLLLVDTDEDEVPWASIAAAVAAGEPGIAVRAGAPFGARLVRAARRDGLPVPADAAAWRLDTRQAGTLDNLRLAPVDPAPALGPGQVRIAVRAAGVNFRDVLHALGMYPGDVVLGGEAAGVVLETGPEVTDLAPGDRVMGLCTGAFGPVAVTDRRLLVPMPAEWTFAEAAAVPIAYATAYYGLVDLGGLRAGEAVLVHAAAGGVGTAAVQLARQLGAEVFATAGPGKWAAVRAMGVADDHLASSRDLGFEASFAAVTSGRGVDVVLDALAGEFVDASLRLLPRGGRFVEMGKTDLRDADEVAAAHPGVRYRAFDLWEAGPERIGEILRELLALFRAGALRLPPIRAFDVRQAPEAFRHVSQARHIGKVVLTVPRPLDRDGTVLVTGGTGGLGAVLTRHLVAAHGVGRLVLLSRSGPAGAGAGELRAELGALGAEVEIVAGDAADRDTVAAVLDAIPADRPLTAVFHTAGVLDDATLAALTPGRLDTVLRPKADAALLLDELTRRHDLAAFVLFSSVAGTLGAAGQGNYAAANALLDALAQARHAAGRPGLALAWGAWDGTAGMAARLTATDRERIARSGFPPLTVEHGLALLDAALAAPHPALVPTGLDIGALTAAGALPPLLTGLVRGGARRAVRDAAPAEGAASAHRLVALGPRERARFLLDLVRSAAAAVLGFPGPQAVEADRAFKELGFDSLTSVELRNRLAAATGLRLSATLVFDHPTARLLAEMLGRAVVGDDAEVVAPAEPADAPTAGVDDPIAIIGMSCRLPGSANSPEALWRIVSEGVDAIAPFPTDRGWQLDAVYASDDARDGRGHAFEGGFIDGMADFDAAFFGISPREALAMDPQQRLLLEAAWETVEHAGIAPGSLAGSATGVYVGAATTGYGAGPLDIPEGTGPHLFLGTSSSVASGRISYVLGLEGPTLTVDTACSSSLVALHMAAEALRRGECSLALVGGVTVLTTPSMFTQGSEGGAVAADGRCKVFSADADGTGWGEGVGMLLTERLSEARRNGHRVLAVLRGSAVNHDGASNGLTAPSGRAQQRVIRQALRGAGLAAHQVDVVEAHGTGTALGDPIEGQALLATYGRERPVERPLWIGSVKSNIGHVQCAAGVAGVIKMVQALRHELLPATLHAAEATPHVDWSSGTMRLLTEPVPWPRDGVVRRAGVSSFGMSGTNAHVIIEEAPAEPRVPAVVGPAPVPVVADAPLPWVLSGRTEPALRAQAERLRARLEERPELATPEAVPLIARALATGRTPFRHRAVLLGPEPGRYREQLEGLAGAYGVKGLVRGEAGAGGPVAFVFPGQGSQWPGMATGLLRDVPVFRDALRECSAALAGHVDWSLEDVLLGVDGAPSLDRLDVVQPVLFAVMVALTALWRAHGIVPEAVVGHSQGEIAAAHVAGALSLADAARIVVVRSRLLASVHSDGAMLTVTLPVDELTARMARWPGRLHLAAVNGPRATVLSGDPAAVDELAAALTADEIASRRMLITGTAHSPEVERLRDEALTALAGITPRAAAIPLYSTVDGGPVDGAALDQEHWYRNMRQPVRFADAVDAMLRDGFRAFVEPSPYPSLTANIEDLADAVGVEDTVVVSTLRRGSGGPERFREALATAFARGLVPDWDTVLPPPGAAAELPELPGYPFQRRRYWLESATPVATAAGSGVPDPADERFWTAVAGGDPVALADALDVSDPGQRELLAGAADALPVLSAWRAERGDRSTVDAWRYRIAWRRRARLPEPILTGRWLLVAPAHDPDDLAGRCARALAERGVARVLTVTWGDDDPHGAGLAARIEDALAEAAAGGDGRVDGLLSLLGPDTRPGPDGVAVGVAATLALVQAVEALDLAAPLWLATRGAVSVGPADPLSDPAQAGVWGLGLVTGLELPSRWGGLVDLPAEWDERAADRLVGALAGLDDEDQIAVRPAGVFARRMVRAPLGEAPRGGSWRPTGTALVTGGTGALGGHIARWLAELGAPRIVLTSRSGPLAPGAAELAAELTEAGAEVLVESCDVSDREALRALLAALPEGPPVTTVVHAAGVAQSTPIALTTADELARVVAAKVDGARHLDELLGDGLEAFVLFSSGSAVWGGAGQAAYAAANAHLDALAVARRQRGRVATSVSWGGWDGGGMADAGAIELLGRRGLRLMAPQLALVALGQALAHDETLLTVTDMDWARFAPGYTAARPRPLIGELPEVVRALADGAGEDEPADDAAGSELGRRLAALPAGERRSLLLTLVRTEAAAALGHAGPADIEPGRAFRDLGFDSLTAVDIRNRLRSATGLRLPTTIAFDHPTPNALTDFLAERLLGRPADADTPAVRAPAGAWAADEPIAIVGMACRFPGGVRSPDDLWELVLNGRDAITPFPDDRGWDLEALYDPELRQAGSSYVREGGFLDDAGDFDAEFFGISPREAMTMDPQQRVLLETAWEALENARIDPSGLLRSSTGVFVGTSFQGYGLGGADSLGTAEGFFLAGTGTAAVSGRLSYSLGLEGPAVTVDTACSSSLVALHLAAQALRQGECSLALAGGVTVLPTPVSFTEFSRQRGLAPDGRCKPFAAAADGTGWGEGVGVVTLQRLSTALAEGRRVLAVVAGSAVNQDGASNGMTAPNGPSQRRVIAAALAAARVDAADVDFVEAHGTGTPLGDPIEAQALMAVYGERGAADAPLWIGSVKSNIGHTQSAAGIAGVIKAVLALRHGVLPPTLHVDEPTPHVDWSPGTVALLTEAREWPDTGRVRRAGVSSFGGSGTNAHAIIEQAPKAPPREPAEAASAPAPWLLSARTEGALRAQAARLRSLVADRPELEPADIAWSLATTRTAFEHRAVLLDGGREAPTALAALAAGGLPAGVVRGRAVEGRTAFVFPGQGSQWLGMGGPLLAAEAVFAETAAACDEAFARYTDWSVLDVLRGTEGAASLERDDVIQVSLFTVMVSLAALWRSWGVEPDAVLGHSQGEIAAAHVAGALSLDDAALVVARRAELLPGIAGRGGMLSVALPLPEIEKRIAAWDGRLCVGARNAPHANVVSGDSDALAAFAADCAAERIRARPVRIGYASHSPHVEELAEPLRAALAGVEPRAGTVPFFSSVTGDWIDTTTLDGAYWYDNLRRCVGFEPAVRGLAEQGYRHFVEISPHPTLTMGVQETLEGIDNAGVAWPPPVASLRQGKGDAARMLASAAEAHASGVRVDWGAVLGGRGARAVDLPTYPFQSERYWMSSAVAAPGADPAGAGLDATEHPILTAAAPVAGTDIVLLTGRLSTRTHPWLADHAVLGQVLVPGTAFVELAATVGGQVGCGFVEELTLGGPLILTGSDAVRVQAIVQPPDDTGRRSLGIYSRPDDGTRDAGGAADDWTPHATATLAPTTPEPAPEPGDLTRWPPAGATEIDLGGFYDDLAALGYRYGPAFQAMRGAWHRDGAVYAEVAFAPDTSEERDAAGFAVHPALLDAALHGIGLLRSLREGGEPARAELPFSWRGVRLLRHGVGALRVRLTTEGADGVAVTVAAADGAPVGTVDAIVARPVPDDFGAAPDPAGNALFRVDWVEVAGAPAPGEASWALFGPDPLGLGDRLRAAGARIVPGADEGDAGTARALAPLAAGDGPAGPGGVAHRALRLVRRWLADERRADDRLTIVTRGAVAVDGYAGGDITDLASAAAWGLIRSAQAEHPGRFVLVDVDDDPASLAALAEAPGGEEPQLALRAGRAHAPRLVRAEPPKPVDVDAEGTTLITGGTGTIGSALARHLAAAHGVRRLLLTSRRGPRSPGAAELVAELAAFGCEASVVACDIGERDEVARLLAGIPADRPLRAVVHAAGTVDDGMVTDLDADRLDRVLHAKANGALHLHELTRHLELSTFVLFSSASATFGAVGQANYAAANAYLDALAQHRRAGGLAGVSMAWGPWAEASGMTSRLTDADIRRVKRLGLTPMATADGMALFDAARGATTAGTVPMLLDVGALRTRSEAVPPLLRDLVRPGRTSPVAAGDNGAGLRRRLAELDEAERHELVLDLVRSQLAAVLGHSGPEAVRTDRGFLEIGVDSLTGVELRNRLAALTGLRLLATMVFDHPNPVALTRHLLGELAPEPVSASERALEELDRLADVLGAVDADDADRARVGGRLRELLARWNEGKQRADDAVDLETATAEELFQILDESH